ncbi:hypothetical protein H4W33_009336 [Kibdelosporangium phytohabitans]|nr:hypothetical protein [Kibdelosporangium phytohabitans]
MDTAPVQSVRGGSSATGTGIRMSVMDAKVPNPGSCGRCGLQILPGVPLPCWVDRPPVVSPARFPGPCRRRPVWI